MIDWGKLKAYSSGQRKSFEELCYQIAYAEYSKLGIFTAIDGAGGDGGVEFYLKLNDKDEVWGWQCKFFDGNGRLDESNRKASIKASLKTACRNHPNLTKWILCLKTDLTTDSISTKGKKSKGERTWLENDLSSIIPNEMRVELGFWGKSKFDTVCIKFRNIYNYFFEDEVLTWDRFIRRYEVLVDTSRIKNKYEATLHIQNDADKSVIKVLGGHRLVSVFDKEMDRFQVRMYADEYKNAIIRLHSENVEEGYKSIQDIFKKFTSDKIDLIDEGVDSLSELKELLYKRDETTLFLRIRDFEHYLTKLDEYYKQYRKLSDDDLCLSIQHARDNKDENASENKRREKARSIVFSPLYALGKYAIDSIKSVFRCFELLGQQEMHVIGDAGMGKTHLAFNIYENQIKDKKPAIFLFGNDFNSNIPLAEQIKGQLDIPRAWSFDDFLGALDIAGKIEGEKVLVIIDGLNEPLAWKKIWNGNLENLIVNIKQNYRNLMLITTCRTSYQDEIFPKDYFKNTTGFKKWARVYGFGSLTREAIRKYFEFYKIKLTNYASSINEFSNPLYLKIFCETKNKDRQELKEVSFQHEDLFDVFVEYLEACNTNICKRLDKEKKLNVGFVTRKLECVADYLWNNNARSIPFSDSVGDSLIFCEKEIVEFLGENLLVDRDWQEGEVLRFTYDLLGGFIIAKRLLEKYGGVVKQFVASKEFKSKLLEKSHPLFNDILRCFNVFLVKENNQFLFELIEEETTRWYSVETLFEVNKKFIHDNEVKVKAYLKRVFLETKNIEPFSRFIEEIAFDLDHPLNFSFWSDLLKGLSLPERDYIWTIYINNQFGEYSFAKRLIDWAWSDADKSQISNGEMFLLAQALAWFLASSNRFLRDSTTKALISLLKDRMSVLKELLVHFEKINDPYIYERLYAVAYGCGIRCKDIEALKELCLYIYNTVFNVDFVYPDVLLRDYARETVEYALYCGVELPIDVDKIRPPYISKWVKEFPSNEEIKNYEFDYKAEGFKDYFWAQNEIIHSMQPEHSKIYMYGDFGRYVFQSAFSNWRDVDPQELSNRVVRRIFELGYDVEKFGQYDRDITRYGPIDRRGGKVERIGKKYQWIAFYELLAKVSDNFPMYDESSFREKRIIPYAGPWEPYVRDIDPTMLIKRTGKERNEKTPKYWWFNIQYNDWEQSDKEWLANSRKLPDPKGLICVRDEKGIEWLILQSFPEWAEPQQAGQGRWDHPHKRLWYHIRSYLVPKDTFDSFSKRIVEQRFWGRWMPESRDMYQIFSREYYWSPAYNSFKKPYYSGELWQEVQARGTDECIGKVAVTAENLLWEEEYDCSKEMTISILKPNEIIFNGMHMLFAKREGELVDSDDKVLCFDPSVYNETLSCLLVRKNEFHDFLRKNNLEILWTILGEKQVLGGSMDGVRELKRLEISGTYYFQNNTLSGGLQFNL